MKQHYVPRCYLRRFTDNPKCVYAYDKLKSKAYQASMMSVCFEDDLYSISESFVKENNENGGNIDSYYIETEYFAHGVEKMLRQFLKEIDTIKDEWISGKGYYKLKHVEKKELARHVATQYLRLPLIKKTEVDNYLRWEKAALDMIKEFKAIQTGKQEFRDLDIKITCEEPVLHARLTYMNVDFMDKISEAIAQNIFVFWVSKGNDFYTSDFPVVVSPHVPEAPPLYMGLAQYGGEVTIPLSPSLALSIYDRECFKADEDLDCCFIEADDKQVRRQNYLRYMYATRHVISYKNDFRIIDFVYKTEGKHPFWVPNHKAEIVSGLGKY